MQLHAIDVVINRSDREAVRRLVAEREPVSMWGGDSEDDLCWLRVLVTTDKTQELLDALDERFGTSEQFRVVLVPIEATLPKIEEETKAAEDPEEAKKHAASTAARISREELYQDLSTGTDVDAIYLLTIVLSALVAAIGLMRDDVAIIIGAMVIAPLLKPNVALGLATTLGDGALARRALRTNLVGIGLAALVSAAVGLIFKVDPEVHAIAQRSGVGIGDIVLALAAGAAGAIAMTSGAPTMLIGVMVAVALLPPLVVAMLHVANARWQLALGAGMLVVVNVICVNLSCVATFALRGIRPRAWYEADRARKATRVAVTAWVLALVALAVCIYLVGRLGVADENLEDVVKPASVGASKCDVAPLTAAQIQSNLFVGAT